MDINKNLPRDVFMYLLSIVTLVASAIFFGVLVFQYINVYFSDLINDNYFSPSNYYGTIRQSLATLIVIFPVYVWVTRFLKKDIEKNPEKRELKIRKWLLYLTVFVAAMVLIGDLIALINTYLNGEITMRFILKVLAIIFIAGSVFSHYYFELRELKTKPKKGLDAMSIYSWVVVAVVAVAVVFGFFVAGSPQSQRTVRLDERRVQDLSTLQSQIINYWQKKDELPQNLGQLANDILGIVIPKDPKTGLSYEYAKLGNLKFELCATFETSSSPSSDRLVKPSAPLLYYDVLQNWRHDSGRVCFDRTIDPDLFRIVNPK